MSMPNVSFTGTQNLVFVAAQKRHELPDMAINIRVTGGTGSSFQV